MLYSLNTHIEYLPYKLYRQIVKKRLTEYNKSILYKVDFKSLAPLTSGAPEYPSYFA